MRCCVGPAWCLPDSATMSRSRSGRLGGMQTTRARWMCMWKAIIRASTGSRRCGSPLSAFSRIMARLMGRLAPNESSKALMPWAVGTSVILAWEGGAKPGRSGMPKSTITVDSVRLCASTRARTSSLQTSNTIHPTRSHASGKVPPGTRELTRDGVSTVTPPPASSLPGLCGHRSNDNMLEL